VGSHGCDGGALARDFFLLADCGGGLEAIHSGHLNIHEHQLHDIEAPVGIILYGFGAARR
jgi:hypothetical protein